MIRRIVVVGGGSAGFIAALTLKMKIPQVDITVLRSREYGIIGVGEGTTVDVPKHFHEYLGLDHNEFHRLAKPVWKLGIRYLWGNRPHFNYTFGFQFHCKYLALPKHVGYYCEDDVVDAAVLSGLMDRNKCFARRQDGMPDVHNNVAYHFENEHLVQFLEKQSTQRGVTIVDVTVKEVLQDDSGVTGLRLETGEIVTADLYVDASGFRSELLGTALQEPFMSYASSLFCDRAVVGGWDRRPNEPICPYTTAETMNHGWNWRIDHESRINRGYVYCSSFTSDEEARQEFIRTNPNIEKTRVVKYVTGRRERMWVKNVVAIGNAAGFVEPLQASSIGTICMASQNLTELLMDGEMIVHESAKRLFNERIARQWDDIRRFLAIHYKFNKRLATPFWREAVEKTDLAGAEPIVEYFQEHGPSPLWDSSYIHKTDPFGAEGYLSLLIGQQVPYHKTYVPSEKDLMIWARIRQTNARMADAGFTTEEMLQGFRTGRWLFNQNRQAG